MGKETGARFYRECLHRGYIPLFLKNEILVPLEGCQEIPAMRVPGKADEYQKDILNIMQKFNEFDECGPIYSHGDDSENLSHSEIERWEAAVLKSFSYLVQQEFETSVQPQGQDFYWIQNRCICFQCAGCQQILAYTQYGWPCLPTQKSSKRPRLLGEPEGYEEPSGKDMFHSCKNEGIEFKEWRKTMKWARTFVCFLIHQMVYQNKELFSVW